MELIIAIAYVLGVYIALPMYFLGRSHGRGRRDEAVRDRGIARIGRELARRQRGLIDADDAPGVQDRNARR